MRGGIGDLVVFGPLILALPVAAAAGAVTFLSPCCLPLVPGYLSYVTGMSGAAAGAGASSGAGTGAAAPGPGAVAVLDAPAAAARSRVLAGTALFVLGFAALFAIE